MWRSFAIAFLSFPFTGLAFVIGWAAADLRTGLLAGAAVFTLFFTAAVVNLFFVKTYSYLDAALPAVFAALWSLALAPFSLGLSVFSAPAFIGAGLLLGGCLVIAKRCATGWRWLLLPAAVFLYEMLPVNIPGFVDDTFALGAATSALLAQFWRAALPRLAAELLRQLRRPAGKA
ncbi:MAG TPA: hypothetical protein DCW72_00590 [Elusimicrobia bacterium]|nr:MAG: hypothetical protein A2X29_04705 [Elusimicrobia bacterium GWA2_64_40]OGR65804.1 MAG: hypothetical protein A2X30_10095 [Elusimicrobia bacterium GWB2_63_16]HAN05573.1 hypothetical protein [Elusimicrobiota bacterium]HAU88771.1 hypothetical protein [Elusimicrobiota bacterium]